MLTLKKQKNWVVTQRQFMTLKVKLKNKIK